MHLMKIVFVEESIAAWSVVREKFQPLYILMQTINSYQFLTTIKFQNSYFIFRYFWHIIACAALLQRSVYDWHTLKKVPLDWSVSKFIWTKFAMCASTNKSGDNYRRNLGKYDVTVRQNPVVTLLLL